MTQNIDYGRQETSAGPPSRQVMRHLAVILIVAAILATVFTAWTPASLDPSELAGQLVAAIEGRVTEPTPFSILGAAPQDEQIRVGLVVGHLGLNRETGVEDPGAVCQDGLTELMVNQEVGQIAARALEAAGITVDLLEEFDDRLFGYQAVALVSIHADSCTPINEAATGYKVVSALDTVVVDRSQRLTDCLIDRYARTTGLPFHRGSITRDMTGYHSFQEIHSQTPAAIIELGFLYLDRDFLTEEPETAARGVAEGILCYVNNEPAVLPWEAQP